MEMVRELEKRANSNPQDIRKIVKIKERDKLAFSVRENEIIIRKKEIDPEKFVEDFCNVPKLKKRMNAKELKKIFEKQYEEEYEDLYRR